MTEEHHLKIGSRLGIIETELKNFRQDFHDYKQGVGPRLEKFQDHTTKHCTEIGVLEEQMKIIKWLLGVCSTGIIGILLKMVLK